ncbi:MULTISPECIES: hypothetical protein [unclassified Ruegeria]|uniref:hypothetical protein n=1 Tax=unclassified Ruegeria TaxID=2625375 RepID=UPI00148791AA|nr:MULTISPECIES: hypothetical protein [unclassified Ruegeria]
MSKYRLSRAEAKILIDDYCVQINGKPSSAKTTSKKPFNECAAREWWLESRDRKSGLNDRKKALLKAYFALGGEKFPMTGIPLTDGYFRPDRKVMCVSCQSDLVRMTDGHFCITEKGRAWLADEGEADPITLAENVGSERDGVAFGGRGEGENHRALRLWVLNNPTAIFPSIKLLRSDTEFVLPSGDRLDVIFIAPNASIALEVKSRDSNDADLARGVYQCVKYRAVLEATKREAEDKVEAVLITETELPIRLRNEALRLGITHIIVPHNRMSGSSTVPFNVS